MICRSWYRCFIVCGGTLCVFVYGTLCDVCVFVCDTPLCACAMCICAMCIWAGQPSVKAGIQCEYQPNLAFSCSMITLIISIIAVIVNDTANSTNDDKKPQNASVQTIATANQLLSINVRTICLPSDEDLSVDGSKHEMPYIVSSSSHITVCLYSKFSWFKSLLLTVQNVSLFPFDILICKTL